MDARWEAAPRELFTARSDYVSRRLESLSYFGLKIRKWLDRVRRLPKQAQSEIPIRVKSSFRFALNAHLRPQGTGTFTHHQLFRMACKKRPYANTLRIKRLVSGNSPYPFQFQAKFNQIARFANEKIFARR